MPQKPLIYLCGPIHGLTYDASQSWRDEAERLLAPEFGVLSPLRGRLYAGTDYHEFTDHELVTRDKADIRRARAVLRFYTGTSSEGSAMETFYAASLGTPVVTFGTLLHRDSMSLWLRHHTVRNIPSLHKAVEYLKEHWLLPEETPEPPYDPLAAARKDGPLALCLEKVS